jgi:solute carrier family 34 (sodium-dependent phosphate cotransporter)
MSKIFSVLRFLAVLYLFFVCIDLMGASFKLFGKDTATGLLTVTENPFVGLVIGILATSIMQSSSSTTSIVVGLVGAQTLSIPLAIPIIMGANIGTTITNTIVSMGHIRRRNEFELAFAAATMHDFFNLCSVALFLPLEIFFHPIQKTATFISEMIIGFEGATFNSPLKIIVRPVVEGLKYLGGMIFENNTVLGVVLVVISLGLLIFTLSEMVKISRGALSQKLELIVDKYLFTSVPRAFIIGMIVTSLVQSSSVTTALVVPLIGAEIVKLDAAFPYMLGANIGTTVTAILASLVTGNPAAVTIALCHLVFNLFGTAVFLPLRNLPIAMARYLGRIAAINRWIAIVYTIVVFFVIPTIMIVLI